MIVEVYLRNGAWKARAVGQGYANGLAGIATDFGVSVEEPTAPPSPPPRRPHAPTPWRPRPAASTPPPRPPPPPQPLPRAPGRSTSTRAG